MSEAQVEHYEALAATPRKAASYLAVVDGKLQELVSNENPTDEVEDIILWISRCMAFAGGELIAESAAWTELAENEKRMDREAESGRNGSGS